MGPPGDYPSTRRMRLDPDAEFLSTVGFVSGGHLFSHLYIMAYPPLFPMFVDEFGLNNARLGLIVSVMALAMFLFQAPIGELVDRVGAKRVLVLGILMTALGTALVGFADSYEGLQAFALVSGIGQSAFHPAGYALLSSVSSEELEGKKLRRPLVRGVRRVRARAGRRRWARPHVRLASCVDHRRRIRIGYAALTQVAMSPSHRQRLDDHADDGQPGDHDDVDGGGDRSILLNPPMLAMFGFYFFISMESFGIQTFTVVYAVTDLRLSEAFGNTVLTVFFVVSAVGVLAGGEFADRFDFRKVAVASLGSTALWTWTATLPAVTSGAILLATFSSICVFFGISLPARDRLVNSFSTPDTTGKSFGFAYTGVPLAGFVSPVFLGTVIDVTGSARLAFVLVGLFFFAAMTIAFALFADYTLDLP